TLRSSTLRATTEGHRGPFARAVRECPADVCHDGPWAWCPRNAPFPFRVLSDVPRPRNLTSSLHAGPRIDAVRSGGLLVAEREEDHVEARAYRGRAIWPIVPRAGPQLSLFFTWIFCAMRYGTGAPSSIFPLPVAAR